jgi:hypothetical protein
VLALQKGLDASSRVAQLFEPPQVAAVQAVHPPAAVLSIAIDSDSASSKLADNVPGNANTSVPAAIECVPSATFGDARVPATQPMCRNLTLAQPVVGDGLLPSYVHSPAASGWNNIFEVRRHLCRHATPLATPACCVCVCTSPTTRANGIINTPVPPPLPAQPPARSPWNESHRSYAQVYRVTTVIPRWAALAATPLAGSPHAVVLQIGSPDDAKSAPATCSKLSRADVQPSDKPPTLGQLLCGLVQRADAAPGTAAHGAGPDAAPASASPAGPLEQAASDARAARAATAGMALAALLAAAW